MHFVGGYVLGCDGVDGYGGNLRLDVWCVWMVHVSVGAKIQITPTFSHSQMYSSSLLKQHMGVMK